MLNDMRKLIDIVIGKNGSKAFVTGSSKFTPLIETVQESWVAQTRLNGMYFELPSERLILKEGTFVDEASFELPDNGGAIVLSTDINATIGDKTGWAKRKAKMIALAKSWNQRIRRNSKIKDVADKFSEVQGISFGNMFKGRYRAESGEIFDENSMVVEFVGVKPETLFALADELRKEFDQEAVMVKDYSNNKIFFVDNK
jgi:hypothetical protein